MTLRHRHLTPSSGGIFRRMDRTPPGNGSAGSTLRPSRASFLPGWIWTHSGTKLHVRLPSSMRFTFISVCVCVCVFSSNSFWTSSSLDVPAGVTQEEGHTGCLIHLLSAVRALIFIARRIQPLLSLVDREVEFLCTNDLIVLHPLGIFSFSF